MSDMSSKIGEVVVIQYNWEENMRKNDNIWVYYKLLHEKSIHGNADDGTFNVISKNNRTVLIQYVPKNLQIRFVHPIRIFPEIHSKSIISLDVADGGLGVSASTDNKLHIWETHDGVVRRDLKGHLFDVYSCRLLPSGLVVLSAGADMQIKIWDAVTGDCPVTITGHTASVTDTAVVEKGKNFISVSKDGTARLWNCAAAKCLSTLVKVETEINCCDIIDALNEIRLENSNEMADELEFGTQGKLLAFGCEDGKVYVIDVHGKQILCTHFLSSAVLSICWLNTYRLVIGLEDGRVMTLDAKNIGEVPQVLSHDSASGVLCVKRLHRGFILGRRDGLCQYYTEEGLSPVQLTGPDCDPIYSITKDAQFVYTACRDAIIRKYRIADMRLEELESG